MLDWSPDCICTWIKNTIFPSHMWGYVLILICMQQGSSRICTHHVFFFSFFQPNENFADAVISMPISYGRIMWWTYPIDTQCMWTLMPHVIQVTTSMLLQNSLELTYDNLSHSTIYTNTMHYTCCMFDWYSCLCKLFIYDRLFEEWRVALSRFVRLKRHHQYQASGTFDHNLYFLHVELSTRNFWLGNTMLCSWQEPSSKAIGPLPCSL